MPIMPEPQMQPFDKFDKNSYVLQRKEKDWWPKINKARTKAMDPFREKNLLLSKYGLSDKKQTTSF